MIKLSKNLVYLRKRDGRTQAELADLLNVTPKCISFYELGEKKPSLERLVKISEIFGVTVGDLLKKDLETAPKKYAEVRLELLSQEEHDLINRFQSSEEKEQYKSVNEMQKAADCMAQHIKTFRNQCMKNELADFGSPCAECQYNHQCDFEWLTVMQPILKNSSVEISMALTEQN